MDAKIVLLLLLGVSFLFFGCAKKGAEAEVSAPAGEESEETGEEETGEETVEVEQDEEQAAAEKELADLFKVDTDKPIGDEGLGMSTPGSD